MHRLRPLGLASLTSLLTLALVGSGRSGGAAGAADGWVSWLVAGAPRTSTTAAALSTVSGPAKRKGPKYRATVKVTEHGIPHITAKSFGSLGYGSGWAAADSSICTLADTMITARGQRSRWFGPTARYDDQVTLEASNLQVDAFVTDLRNRRVVERLMASPAGPGKQARQMVRGYVAGVNRWVRTQKVTDPACKKARYLKPNATAPRHLVRRLPGQPAGQQRGVRQGDRRRRPAGPGRPRPARAAAVGVRGGPRRAARRPRSRPRAAVRLQRHRDRRRRVVHRQGHAARQPPLPVARALPLHPAAAHDPRQVRRRRRLADRLARGQHRLEQGRRLEPHGLDRLPVHALRVQDRRPRHPLPQRRGRGAAARAPRGPGQGQAPQRLDRHRHRGPLPHAAGLRLGRSRAADAVEPGQLLGDPRRQRRAAAHDRHLPRHGQGDRRARPAPPSGRRRRHAVGQHHRGRPQGQRPVRRPLGGPARHQRRRRPLHDPGRPHPRPGGRSARPRRHLRRQLVRLGPRRRRAAPRHPRAAAPAERGAPRLRDERQRLVLAAEPRRPARGLPRHHRLREVRADDAHQDGHPVRRRPARLRPQGDAGAACAPTSTPTGCGPPR